MAVTAIDELDVDPQIVGDPLHAAIQQILNIIGCRYPADIEASGLGRERRELRDGHIVTPLRKSGGDVLNQSFCEIVLTGLGREVHEA